MKTWIIGIQSRGNGNEDTRYWVQAYELESVARISYYGLTNPPEPPDGVFHLCIWLSIEDDHEFMRDCAIVHDVDFPVAFHRARNLADRLNKEAMDNK